MARRRADDAEGRPSTSGRPQPQTESPPSTSAAESAAQIRPQSPFLAAAVGQLSGMAGNALIHPLDTVKCRLQARGPADPASASGTFIRMLKLEGPSSLIRGIGGPLMLYGAVNAVAWTANSQALRALCGSRTPGRLETLASGCLSGAACSVVCGPLERVKTVLQVNRGTYSGSTVAAALQLAREQGIVRGWFAGTGATVARNIPLFGAYFLSYQEVSRMAHGILGEENRTASTLIAGGAAGVLSWVPAYPFDVVKSRIQAAAPGTYKGWLDCLSRSIAQDGWACLWRGSGLAMLRALPLHATIFYTTEKLNGIIGRVPEEHPRPQSPAEVPGRPWALLPAGTKDTFWDWMSADWAN